MRAPKVFRKNQVWTLVPTSYSPRSKRVKITEVLRNPFTKEYSGEIDAIQIAPTHETRAEAYTADMFKTLIGVWNPTKQRIDRK